MKGLTVILSLPFLPSLCAEEGQFALCRNKELAVDPIQNKATDPVLGREQDN